MRKSESLVVVSLLLTVQLSIKKKFDFSKLVYNILHVTKTSNGVDYRVALIETCFPFEIRTREKIGCNRMLDGLLF